jgi:hypothetical protein
MKLKFNELPEYTRITYANRCSHNSYTEYEFDPLELYQFFVRLQFNWTFDINRIANELLPYIYGENYT